VPGEGARELVEEEQVAAGARAVDRRRAAQLTRWFDALLEEAVLERFGEGEGVPDAVAAARSAVAAGDLTAPKAVAEILGRSAEG